MHIKVATRSSRLAMAQVQEVLEQLLDIDANICFDIVGTQTTGDKDQTISLRTLDKTDFFTKEVDLLVYENKCRISIHSAKDLPQEIPEGLQIVAITSGQDPSDSLVMNEFDTFDTLPPNTKVATSSEKRQMAVQLLRDDFIFQDIRGTIDQRLSFLEKGEIGVLVVAEAAIIRLKLQALNRIRLPGSTTKHQGQLAILAKKGDKEMEELFFPLNAENLPKALYLGPEFPRKKFKDRHLVHHPLIDTFPLPISKKILEEWPKFSHVLFTSKQTVRHLINFLRSHQISANALQQKVCLAIGKATADALQDYHIPSLVSQIEQGEGMVQMLQTIGKSAYVFYPHSNLCRPLIKDALCSLDLPHLDIDLYTTSPANTPLPDLQQFQEVIFSSPSTVAAFFSKEIPKIPLKYTPIGPITAQFLAKYTSIVDNNF